MKLSQAGMDFVVVIVIFLVISTYLFFRTFSYKSWYLQKVRENRLELIAYEISEILINDPGEPVDWDAANVKRIGLSDEKANLTNLVWMEKIKALASICSNYEDVRKKLGVSSDVWFSIEIEVPSQNYHYVCQPTTIISRGFNYTFERVFVARNQTFIGFGKLKVTVW